MSDVIARDSGSLWVAVRNVLNKYGGEVVDNDTASAFDTRGNVWWGARWKPVAQNVTACQDYDASEDDYLEGWWRAYISGDTYNSGRCGVSFPEYTSTASLEGVTESTWSHKSPAGSSSQPFRIGDFRGYNPNARHIIAGVSVNPEGDVFMSETGYKSNISVSFNDNLDTDALDYTEIGYRSAYDKWLNDFYFGVIAIKTDGYYHGVVSLPYTMEQLNSVTEDEYYAQTDRNAYVNLNGGVFGMAGEYRLYPVLFYEAQTAQNSTDAISCGTYIPLPVEPMTVNVITPSTLYSAEITSVSLSGNSLTINYKVSAESGFTFAFSPTTNTPTLTVRGYTDIAVGKTLFPYSGNTFASFVGTYEVPSGGSVNCSDVVNILTPTDDSGIRYKYLSVDIRWDDLGVGASKMDIEI